MSCSRRAINFHSPEGVAASRKRTSEGVWLPDSSRMYLRLRVLPAPRPKRSSFSSYTRSSVVVSVPRPRSVIQKKPLLLFGGVVVGARGWDHFLAVEVVL